MKRLYIKPESKLFCLQLYSFMAGSGNETTSQIDDPDNPDNPIGIGDGGEGDDPNGSRYLRRSMWED